MYVSMPFARPFARRARHPLLRAIALVLGVMLVGVLMLFGLVVGSVLLIGGGLLLAWRHRHRTVAPMMQPSAAHQTNVLEGEFTVVRQDQPLPR
jgi:hypothetical protein